MAADRPRMTTVATSPTAAPASVRASLLRMKFVMAAP